MLPTLLLPLLTSAAHLPRQNDDPQVTLDYATFEGTTAFANVDSYLGMPFAIAGRLENPRVIGAQDRLNGTQSAKTYGLACPQQQLVAAPLGDSELGGLLAAVEQLAYVPIAYQGEDCLSINVQVPSGINSTAGLPVMMWIHGGGFELGSSAGFASETEIIQGVIYQGAHLVQRSLEMGQPIVFVSANYRLNAFGGLASQEITDAGVANLGLKDQRVAMQWIQKYISSFGGDPNQVTIFGESAGSMSVATHLVLNNGDPEGLFHAAIMSSGGIAKFKDYHHGQATFDQLANCTGCGEGDKLACLRTVEYGIYYNCLQQFPNFFSYVSTSVQWYPRPDGTFLTDSPHRLLREGKVANVPYIIGDMNDEGTLFSVVPQLNITTDEDFQSFFQTEFFQTLTPQQIADFTSLYPQDPTAGSPFDTGLANEIGPQYKRLAAAVGDYTFQMGRRDLLNYTQHFYPNQTKYTYRIDQSLYILGQIPLLETLVGLPILGSFHVSDVVLNTFGLIPETISKNTLNIMSTFIAFVNSQDPNEHGLEGVVEWPQWTEEGKEMFLFQEDGPEIIRDDYRQEAFDFVNARADLYVY